MTNTLAAILRDPGTFGLGSLFEGPGADMHPKWLCFVNFDQRARLPPCVRRITDFPRISNSPHTGYICCPGHAAGTGSPQETPIHPRVLNRHLGVSLPTQARTHPGPLQTSKQGVEKPVCSELLILREISNSPHTRFAPRPFQRRGASFVWRADDI